MPTRLNPKSKRQGLYLDTAEWETEVANLLKHVKKSAGDLIENEAKLLVIDCIRLTPPTTGGAGVMSESLSKQYKAGQKAIYNDIKKVILRYPNLSLYKNPKVKRWLGKAYKEGNWELVMDIIGDQSGKAGDRVPDNFHESMRNRRGRIPKTNPKRFYVKNESTIKEYAEKIYQKIGKAKAGWLPAAKGLKVPKRHRIAFISRHRGKGLIRKQVGKSLRSFVHVANLVDYIQKHGRERRIMAVAMKSRTNKIREKIANILKSGAAKKW